MLLVEALKKHCNIYCICLEECNDRYESACKEFDKIGLKDFVYFHRPKYHEKGGIYGNFESMLWCLNNSLNKDPSKLILILEDDIFFSVNRFLNTSFSNMFIDTNNLDKWDTIRLGYWKGIFIDRLYEDTITTSFYRGNCRGAHAIIWSPIFANKVLKHNITIEQRGIIDWYLCQNSGRHYLLNKALCYQKPGFKSFTIWPSVNVQKSFLEDSVKFQLKYQHRTYNAWNWIGRFIPNNFITNLIQLCIVMDIDDIISIITKRKGYYIFKNKCIL